MLRPRLPAFARRLTRLGSLLSLVGLLALAWWLITLALAQGRAPLVRQGEFWRLRVHTFPLVRPEVILAVEGQRVRFCGGEYAGIAQSEIRHYVLTRTRVLVTDEERAALAMCLDPDPASLLRP